MEVLYEIYLSIRQNKIRTFLSGFGISWGILILVVLLGTGKGFQNSVMDIFSIFAQKSMYVYGGATSMKYKNIREGEQLHFDLHFLNRIKKQFPGIKAISPEITGPYSQVMNKAKSGLFKIIGINENYMGIKILKINEDGRYFNKGDDENTRNVTIIGENVSTTLFNNQKALGKSINIAGIDFKVIGVLKNDDIFSASEINSVYVPFSSYINCIDNKTPLRAFCLYLNKEVDSKRFENELRAFIANKYQFAYSDKQALQIINFETQTSAFEGLFDGLKMFIWIVGICFLISGIVGVSNIMFVVIKERSREIGIRKAVGATPKSILVLMLTESVIITVISGIIGLISGAAILEIINWLLESARHATMIKHAEIDINVAVLALVILILSGVIAGAFPAMKASVIQPIDAIRNENIG